MATVFITQEVSSLDYSAAMDFGDLVFVTSQNDRLSPIPTSINNQNIIDRVTAILRKFNPDEDLLLCTGAPAHMAICAAVLGDRLDKLLVWDNRDGKYFIIRTRRNDVS